MYGILVYTLLKHFYNLWECKAVKITEKICNNNKRKNIIFCFYDFVLGNVFWTWPRVEMYNIV